MRRIFSVRLRSPMRPCTSDLSPVCQSIKLMALMAITAFYPSTCLTGSSNVPLKLPEPRGCNRALGDLALNFALAMPRVRGRPRRGAGWYTADSRRKRHRNFKRAMTLAKQRRRRAITAASSPPGTVVEEDLSIELPPDFSESKMFTVPDNWDPPTCFVDSEAMPRAKDSSDPCVAPCIIEEEPQVDTGGEEGAGRLGKDDKLSTPPSPPLLLPEQLQLIFEVRSLVDDQIFRAVCVSQRLDMLYAAYSSATPKRQCPTCAQSFSIPASEEEAKDANGSAG
jgi:hypothetical protein